jgi:hypothetical protein
MKDISEMFGDIMKMKNAFEHEIKHVFPEEMSNDVVKMALENFSEQSFDAGSTITPWPQLSLETQKAKLRRHQGKISNILVDSGRGRIAVSNMKREPFVGDGVIELNFEITAPYMRYHNEGGSIDGRPPKREFVGTSEKMQTQINKRVEESFIRVSNAAR